MRRVFFTIITTVFLLMHANTTQASVANWLGLDDVGSSSVDKAAAAIMQALSVLRRMQDEFDADVTVYIAELDRISAARLAEVDKTVGNIDKVVDDLVSDVDEIVQSAFYDIREIIWEVRCLAPTFADEFEKTFSDTLKILSDSNIVINLPISEVTLSIDPVDLATPDRAYFDLKKDFLAKLNDADADMAAIDVIALYGNISRVAQISSCHFRGQTFGRYLLSDAAYYEMRAASWGIVTGID